MIAPAFIVGGFIMIALSGEDDAKGIWGVLIILVTLVGLFI